MTRRRITRLLALATLAAITRPWRFAAADTGAFKVVVHPDRPIGALDRDFLRRVYLKKVVSWPDGDAIHPIDLPRAAPERVRFARDVLKKTPAQLRSYWSQQVFSGKATPPPEAASAAAAIAFVLSDAGAVAYVPADVDVGHARVVELG